MRPYTSPSLSYCFGDRKQALRYNAAALMRGPYLTQLDRLFPEVDAPERGTGKGHDRPEWCQQDRHGRHQSEPRHPHRSAADYVFKQHYRAGSPKGETDHETHDGFQVLPPARNVLVGIERMHMIRKGQMITPEGADLSFADQFYTLAE